MRGGRGSSGVVCQLVVEEGAAGEMAMSRGNKGATEAGRPGHFSRMG